MNTAGKRLRMRKFVAVMPLSNRNVRLRFLDIGRTPTFYISIFKTNNIINKTLTVFLQVQLNFQDRARSKTSFL